MARTSRNGAPATTSVDALDNLNLDDMFADDGDALFDGLDIDLGNMDDLAGGPSTAGAAGAEASSSLTSPKSKTEPLHPHGAFPSSPSTSTSTTKQTKQRLSASSSATTTTPKAQRRKTKRKLKPPAHFHDEDDNDDDYVDEKVSAAPASSTAASQRKKKNKKATPKAAAAAAAPTTTRAAAAAKAGGAGPKTNKRGTTKAAKANAAAAAAAAAAVAPTATNALSADTLPSKVAPVTAATATATTTKNKAKGRTSVTMPPPSNRSASSSVAAAGQFGGRQAKRSSVYTLPKASKSKAAQRQLSTASAATSAASSVPSSGGDVVGKDKQKSATNTAAAATQSSSTATAPSPTSASTMAQIQASHPGLSQSPFCGLLPSNTLFYPFMPSLPAEPSFKHRKIFAIIDRIHTSFLNHLGGGTAGSSSNNSTTVSNTNTNNTSNSHAHGLSDSGKSAMDSSSLQPIFQLMQEAFKEEKPDAPQQLDKVQAMTHAVTASRKTIAQSEKLRLAGDLLAVCALLKRQHDFLKQNVLNMEQWCKSHFSESDYASVYQPTKLKKRKAGESSPASTSVLSTFTVAELKVKVICTGFKEPRPLVAILPAHAVSHTVSDVKTGPSKSKKRKLSTTTGESASKVALSSFHPAAGPPITESPPKPPPTYVNMTPSRRRQNVTDLISRMAAELETRLHRQSEEHKRSIDRQQAELQKFLHDEHAHGAAQAMHTTGMWQWLEKSGHFEPITEEGIRWRLQNVDLAIGESHPPTLPDAVVPKSLELSSGASLIQRLQSLLVDESYGEDSIADDNDDDDDDDIDWDDQDDTEPVTSLIDLSELTADERALLQLRSVGVISGPIETDVSKSSSLFLRSGTHLSDPNNPSSPPSFESYVPPRTVSVDISKMISTNDRATVGPDLKAERIEVDEVIGAMIEDLTELNGFNKRRASYLEAIVSAQMRVEGTPRTKAEEAALVLKCQQLLKKSREVRVKNGKAKKDELALPW